MTVPASVAKEHVHVSEASASGPDESQSTTSSSPFDSTSRSVDTHAAGSHSLFLRDSIIGFADGLTVPFALTAGLSSLGSSRLVVLAGLAELFAGSLSMGLGAYLAAATERQHYEVAERRQRRALSDRPAAQERALYALFARYGLSHESAHGVVEGLRKDEDSWVRFVMGCELQLEKPRKRIAFLEGLVMGVSYFFGGLLPMIPYFAFQHVTHALFSSIGITAVILLVFGYIKALITGTSHGAAAWSAVQTLFVGTLAAAVSYGIVRGVNSSRVV